jgi:uncharacterized protein (DUF1800 family)
MNVPHTDSWAPYTPDDKAPWDLRRVVHLHRRAGFAATWPELQRDLKEGPAASIQRFLVRRASAHTPDDFAATAELLSTSAIAAGDIVRLRAWWFYRMLFGPDQLGEKLTLLWHDHFATANAKVQDVSLMWRQNDTLRRHARDRFADLLNLALREPALLLYLDAQTNRKGHPNENLARELMELFTLGAGNFSESDVKDAARALTGWTVEDGQFATVLARHDSGTKTILGETGSWTPPNLLALLLRQPATSQRIAVKLCRQFFGENAVGADAMRELASDLREHDLDIGRAVEKILRSRLFFADANIGNRVLSPTEFVAGAVRALGLFDPAPSTLALADWTGRMGQELFDPPNVGGWPPGLAWIHTRALIARSNFAVALTAGRSVGLPMPLDAAALARKYDFGSSPDAVLIFFHRLLFGTDPPAGVRRRVNGAASSRVIDALLSSPEAQLG